MSQAQQPLPSTRAPRCLGVLMLDTQFPRPIGDVGCLETFTRHGIAVKHRVVEGAWPKRVVRSRDAALLDAFIRQAEVLQGEGAALITTSCGFAAAWQQRLQDALSVPVVTSSLLACASVPSPGIVTIDADALDASVLRGAGVPLGTPVVGVRPDGELAMRILNNERSLDLDAARRDVTEAAERLMAAHPHVQTIVLECTNMPPYRLDVQRATQRAVVDIETLIIERWNDDSIPTRSNPTSSQPP